MLFAFGPSSPEPQKDRREDPEFRAFWDIYPRRVAPLAAQKAFAKARKVASLEQILAGVQMYKRTKPAYADWCHPATWLNQGRWLDEVDGPKAAEPEWSCNHTPPCHDKVWCRMYRDAADAIKREKAEPV